MGLAKRTPVFRVSDKVSKGAKIRNRYNQVPHLTQDTNGKVTNSQQTQNILLEGLNRFNGANLTLNSDVDQDT